MNFPDETDGGVKGETNDYFPDLTCLQWGVKLIDTEVIPTATGCFIYNMDLVGLCPCLFFFILRFTNMSFKILLPAHCIIKLNKVKQVVNAFPTLNRAWLPIR